MQGKNVRIALAMGRTQAFRRSVVVASGKNPEKDVLIWNDGDIHTVTEEIADQLQREIDAGVLQNVDAPAKPAPPVPVTSGELEKALAEKDAYIKELESQIGEYEELIDQEEDEELDADTDDDQEEED